MKTTKLSHAIPSAEEDYDYYSSYPSFNEFTAKMGQRISKRFCVCACACVRVCDVISQPVVLLNYYNTIT